MRITRLDELRICDQCGILIGAAYAQTVTIHGNRAGTYRHYCNSHKRPYNSVTVDGLSPPYPRYYMNGKEIDSLRGKSDA